MCVIWYRELLLPVARLSEPYLKITKQSMREGKRYRKQVHNGPRPRHTKVGQRKDLFFK